MLTGSCWYRYCTSTNSSQHPTCRNIHWVQEIRKVFANGLTHNTTSELMRNQALIQRGEFGMVPWVMVMGRKLLVEKNARASNEYKRSKSKALCDLNARDLQCYSIKMPSIPTKLQMMTTMPLSTTREESGDQKEKGDIMKKAILPIIVY